MIGFILCVCACVYVGGDASVRRLDRTGAVLLHAGAATRRCTGAGAAARPAGGCTRHHCHHPSTRPNHHRPASAGPGKTYTHCNRSLPVYTLDNNLHLDTNKIQSHLHWGHMFVFTLMTLDYI